MLDAEMVIDIEAPAKKVWDHLADFSRWGPLFEPQYKSFKFKLVESAMMGVQAGRKVLWTADGGFSQEWTIKEWEPLKVMRLTAETLPAVDVLFTLSSVSAALTQVQLRYQMDFKDGWIDLLGKFFSLEQRHDRMVAGMLDNLKTALQA